jgi:hypothetical protein
MFIMSTWALIKMFLDNTSKDGAFVGLPAGANSIVPITCAIYIILAIWMAAETIRAVSKAKSGKGGGEIAAAPSVTG